MLPRLGSSIVSGLGLRHTDRSVAILIVRLHRRFFLKHLVKTFDLIHRFYGFILQVLLS